MNNLIQLLLAQQQQNGGLATDFNNALGVNSSGGSLTAPTVNPTPTSLYGLPTGNGVMGGNSIMDTTMGADTPSIPSNDAAAGQATGTDMGSALSGITGMLMQKKANPPKQGVSLMQPAAPSATMPMMPWA